MKILISHGPYADNVEHEVFEANMRDCRYNDDIDSLIVDVEYANGVSERFHYVRRLEFLE